MEKKHLLIILLLLFPFVNFSQDGSLDSSFGDNGYVFSEFFGLYNYPKQIIQQNDGKTLVLGIIEDQNTNYSNSITRYLPSGGIDLSFGDNGSIYSDFGYRKSIAIQEDNKILNGADYYVEGEEKNFLIKRYLPDGTLDDSFGDNGIVVFNIGHDILENILIQSDGKIIAYGVSEIDNEYYSTIIRLLPDGSLDNIFGNNGVVSTFISENYFTTGGGLFKSNGKLLLLMRITNDDSLKLYQFLNDGELDITFNDNGIKEIDINSTNLSGTIGFTQTNIGAILLAYTSLGTQNDTVDSNLLKLNDSGDIDLNFGNNGVVNFGSFIPNRIFVQENNKILIGGGNPFFEGASVLIKRLLDNGSVDNSFSVISSDFQYSDFILQNNGKITWIGNTYIFSGPSMYVLARYNNNPLGIEDQQLENVSVYPNPSNGVFKIKHDYLVKETPYQIFDITGKLIQTGKLSGEQTHIDLIQVQSGVYLLNASGKTYKLIKN